MRSSQHFGRTSSKPNENHTNPEPFLEARIGVVDLGSTSFHAVVSTVSFERSSLVQGPLGQGPGSLVQGPYQPSPVSNSPTSADHSPSNEIPWPTHYRFSRVARSRHAVTLGAQVAAHGHISAECNQRAIAAARDLGKFLAARDAQQVVAVATAALRQAENGDQVVARLEKALGYPIEILSGWAEASSVFRGQQAGLSSMPSMTSLVEPVHLGEPGQITAANSGTGLTQVPSVTNPPTSTHLRLACMDLGGGSLEVAWGRASASRPQLAISLPLGVGHFVHLLDAQGRLRDEAREEISQRVCETLARHDRHPRHDLAIASGGTARTLARIFTKGRLGPNVHGVVIPQDSLAELSDLLARTTNEERALMPGMPKKRVLTAGLGATILQCTAEALGMDSLITSVWGMREGLAISAARKLLANAENL